LFVLPFFDLEPANCLNEVGGLIENPAGNGPGPIGGELGKLDDVPRLIRHGFERTGKVELDAVALAVWTILRVVSPARWAERFRVVGWIVRRDYAGLGVSATADFSVLERDSLSDFFRSTSLAALACR
jgi:hypothetical protein